MNDWIENTIDQLNAYPQNTGVVIGILQDGRQSVYSYGRVSESDGQQPQTSTLFEIGSVSKIFTTALLSILINDGLLNLNDPVCEVAPELANLPPEITLGRLATHTSGLPKMPSNIFRSMLSDRRNPYAAYSTSDLISYLSKTQTKWRSEKQIRYSNLGMGLLGYLLGRKLGVSYEQALIIRICDPLNLEDTRITLSGEQRIRLAPPHTSRGNPAHYWDMPAFAGAGGLRGTLQDLLKFLDVNMMDEASSQSEAKLTCHEVRTTAFLHQGPFMSLTASVLNVRALPDPYRQGMALGWYVGHLQSGDHEVHWHHGATGGYRSFVAFVKGTKTGIAVLANSGPRMMDGLFSTTATDHLSFRILEKIHTPG
jgi:CubicO group peptidase (beta-lactamase class C family)